MTTPTTAADHRAAKALADRAGLTVPPWQLESIAATLAEARAEGWSAALAFAAEIAARLRDEQGAEPEADALAAAREQGRIEGASHLFSSLGIGALLLRRWADHLEGLGVIEGEGPR